MFSATMFPPIIIAPVPKISAKADGKEKVDVPVIRVLATNAAPPETTGKSTKQALRSSCELLRQGNRQLREPSGTR